VSEPARRVGGGLGASQQLSHKVADNVRERIVRGELPAGEFLRTETLASELGVSATPVREALMALQSEGSVRWEPRRGYRVVTVSEEDVRDLFQVQAYLAGELAARAADVLDADAIDGLRELQTELEAAAARGDAVAVGDLNDEIHRRINKASKSERLATLLKQTVQYVPLRFFGTVEGWSQASAHDHWAIFDALGAGNGDAARDAMGRHIRHVGELVISHLKTHRGSPPAA
jgi:DNA-binding GntR family transcriptional regulator